MMPEDLRFALEQSLESVPSRDLAGAVRDLSERYRGHAADAAFPPLRADVEAAAYVAYRLPATYAAVSAVLREVHARQPDMEPTSLLDVGAGPGTAAWAAADVWPSLRTMTLVERDPRMVRIGRRLAAGAGSEILRRAHWEGGDLAGLEVDRADVVTASYVLGELPRQGRADGIGALWQQTNESLVIVEPGTPQGYRRVREAGEVLIAEGAFIIAPTPHDWQCVESEEDWCHFAARVGRTRLHRLAKDVSMAYEDEKYAYVVASRRPGRPIGGRVIRRPQIHSGHVRLVVCTARGVRRLVVSRKQREAYRRARDLQWGAAIEADEMEMFGLL